MEYHNDHPSFKEYLEIMRKSKQYVIKDGYFESHLYRIKMPKTISTEKRSEELQNKRRNETRKLFEIRENMILSEDHLKFKDAFNSIVVNIHKIDEELIKIKDRNYLVLEIPTVEKKTGNDIMPIDQKKKRAVKKVEEKKKAVFKKVSPRQMEMIKDNVRKLLKEKFKFSNKEECVSKARSKPFYMTQKEILEEIENNADIKNEMPYNYKKMSKEELCEHLDQMK